MDKSTRNAIQRATQAARALLEEEYRQQLEGTFDVLLSGKIADAPGSHLSAEQAVVRDKLVAAVAHKRATGMKPAAAVADYLRDAAFTALNRFVALKMLEARDLVQECVSKGEESSGFKEFTALAPGLGSLPDKGYRLYIESLFDEIATEVRVLFDRRDPASLLWPRRQALMDLLGILNAPELESVWAEDETIGWVYQYFNGDDERAKMRDTKRGGSQAPRNSRELAVRNQFFTPRYVVEFLVDNSLGRTWLEMVGDESRLKSECEYFVRPVDEEPRRRDRKDPRDLRILDPACGSGHFLLYCFDLLLTIYEEAWEDPEAAASELTGRTLREDYSELSALRAAAPALILEHNLHGVDIDPRCAQIAALALWMRAQRAYRDLGLDADARTPIRRTNIIVAEPMPGDAALVDEFAAELEPPLLRDLFRKMVDEMKLAGEMGVLLKIEEAIADELAKAKEQFVALKYTTGFLPGLQPTPVQGEIDLSGIDDDRFFQEAEARIVEVLRSFAERAAGAAGVRRRLFVGDATQGMALIDLVRGRFDVVLMNPPFGAGSTAAKRVFDKSYPRTKNDVYAAFVQRGIELLWPRGVLGAITSRTGFFLSSFQTWREDILLSQVAPVVVADLGLGVMDAALVEAAAYCVEKQLDIGSRTVFLRTLEEVHDKRRALRASIQAGAPGRFEVSSRKFAVIPRSPFAYWLDATTRNAFQKFPLFETAERCARQGLASADDFRFLRLWWEVEARQHSRWLLFAKGGVRASFYGDIYLMVLWGSGGRELRAFPNAVPRNTDYYGRPGLTWTLRTKSAMSLRVLPRGCAFGHKGPAAFVDGDVPDSLFALLAMASSRAFATLVEVQLAAGEPTGRGGVARSYEVGLVQRTPVPPLALLEVETFAHLARRAWSAMRTIDSYAETSHAFVAPSLGSVHAHTLAERALESLDYRSSVAAEIASLTGSIDIAADALYGFHDGAVAGKPELRAARQSDADDEDSDSDDPDAEVDAAPMVASLLSWSVGVAFGRFDVGLATGERAVPPQPEPFDPLPPCSPGMLTGDAGLPLDEPPPGYPIAFPTDGVLVDDPGHPRDLIAAARQVFDVVFLDDTAERWQEAAELVGARKNDLRDWFGRTFFEQHLKRYSKSRRKAPIYWQLATPSASYSVWLYCHRLTRDSFFKVLNDYVKPKLEHEESKLTTLVQAGGPNPSTSQGKAIAKQEAFVEELRAFREEVERVAPLFHPDLDDGIVLVKAPLWRLVPQHRAWQKELLKKWGELQEGKYDWAHLAMHLWPERVVPKCADDRSLAIAHDLEDVFWVEDDDGKWQKRDVAPETIETLVAERTSAAVKDALKNLLDAPAPKGGRGRRKRRKK